MHLGEHPTPQTRNCAWSLRIILSPVKSVAFQSMLSNNLPDQIRTTACLSYVKSKTKTILFSCSFQIFLTWSLFSYEQIVNLSCNLENFLNKFSKHYKLINRKNESLLLSCNTCYTKEVISLWIWHQSIDHRLKLVLPHYRAVRSHEIASACANSGQASAFFVQARFLSKDKDAVLFAENGQQSTSNPS